MAFRAVKGMNDILPDEIGRWQRLEEVFRRTVELYGFREIRTPLVESTELFVRSIGEATDVVEKEMYSFERHHDSLTLRPEGTAGAARAYLEHRASKQSPVTRWYYQGPMFRAERPQRGRYRQFYQAGCEVYGDAGPIVDAEVIEMLVSFFSELGVGELEVAINSLGGQDTRERYRTALAEFFESRHALLSDHARARLATNPLRILDSKDPQDVAACDGAPSLLEHLDEEDRAHWDALVSALAAMETPVKIEPTLVRGLDYYTRTLFEVRSTAGALGSQNALAGGGRYDGLVQALGGPPTPAIGFALGIERVLLAMTGPAESVRQLCFIAPMGAMAAQEGLIIARLLRREGVQVELDGRGGSMKSMLRRADAMTARICLILGESEIQRSVVQMKDLREHSQREVPRGSVVEAVLSALGRSDKESPRGSEGSV